MSTHHRPNMLRTERSEQRTRYAAARGVLLVSVGSPSQAPLRWPAIVRVAVLSVLAGATTLLATSVVYAAERCKPDVNCIVNPSFEADGEDAASMPAHWHTSVYGESDAAFTTTAGRTDGRAATVTVTTHASPQDAKWVFDEVPVTGGEYYEFSDWYKSTSPTEIYAFFNGGTVPYIRITSVPASETPETWTEVKTPGFFIPAGVTAMTVTHSLVGDGVLTTDDYSLVQEPPPVFRRGLVSLAFDDGWQSIYANAIPILNAAGFKSTQYIYTDPINNPDAYARNMTKDDILALQDQGHEIGAHTRLHVDLVDGAKDHDARVGEIEGSQRDLLAAGITHVDTFAYPDGHYNDDVRSIVASHFIGARTATLGYNTTDTDKFALRTLLVLKTTSVDDIENSIDYALANNLWLIITFHRVLPSLDDCVFVKTGQDDLNCTDVATLQAVVDHLRTVGGRDAVETVHDVLADDELWTRPPPDDPRDVAGPPPGADPLWDPPSTYAGERLTLEYLMNLAYTAGFHTEDQLLAVLGVAIGESDLWTAARNWHPELGFRKASDKIDIQGPAAAWSTDGRQMQSDRGLYQLSSQWWPNYTDAETDDPFTAMAAFFDISKQGTDFMIWDSFRSGRAQNQYDQPFKGWPALRPLVVDFLKRAAPEQLVAGASSKAPDGDAAPASEIASADAPKAVAADPQSAAEPAAASPDTPESVLAGLEKAAAAGNGWAEIGLAEALIKGDGTTADPDRAVALLQKAAAEGLKGPAMGTLGAYYRSIGDDQRAIAALDDAAAANDGQAQLLLADMLIKGEGTPPDADRAVTLLEKAGDAGLQAPAYKALGSYYASVGDNDRARSAFEQSAKAGDVEAKLHLGEMLVKGENGAADPEQGIALLKEAAAAGFAVPATTALADYYRSVGDAGDALAVLEPAAKAGGAEAKLILADMLIKGEGTTADAERAITLLEEAAKAGLPAPAYTALGDYYLTVDQHAEAVAAFEQAADAGSAEAKLTLGKMLIEDPAGDAERAIALLEEAADAGLAPASKLLGDHYLASGDDARAVVAFGRAADAGDPEAKLTLGKMLIAGQGTAVDADRGIALLEQAAEAGSAGPAFAALGSYYRTAGQADKALAALDKAAAAGDAEAELNLGEMLIKGEGTPTDPARAVPLLKQAAEAGWAGRADASLGQYYRRTGDDQEALAALQAASDAGEAEAKVALADMLIKGEGTPIDPQGAIALLEEAADAGAAAPAFKSVADYYHGIGDNQHERAFLERAAKGGDAEAELALAGMLINGDGGVADPDRAVALLQQAANAGQAATAFTALGNYYLAAGDREKAVAAFGQAVDAGDTSAELSLGKLLIDEKGSASDHERAIGLLQQAAAKGLTGPALAALGSYYRSAGDTAKALDALNQAVDANDPDAKLVLGEMLIKGEGTAPRPDQAISLLDEAASAGRKGPALRILGEYYLTTGARKKAASTLEQAADAGDSWARVTLASMLIDGNGVPADPEKARALLQAALKQGQNPLAYIGLVQLAAAEFRTGALDGALSLLKDADAADTTIALNSFERLQPNDKTAMVQAILQGEKFYTGPINGRLTGSTLDAIRRFCSKNAIAEACRSEAVPVALLSALIKQL